MSERDLVSFHTTEEDRKLQAEEIIPFWKGRSMREKLLAAMTPSGTTVIQQVCSQSSWSREDRDIHVVVNRYSQQDTWIIKKDQKSMDALDFMNDPEAYDKMEELKAMDISCDAVIILGEI